MNLTRRCAFHPKNVLQSQVEKKSQVFEDFNVCGLPYRIGNVLIGTPHICKDIKGAQLYVVEETSKNRAKWARIIMGIFLLCNIKGYKFSSLSV